MNLPVYNLEGSHVGKIKVSDEVFKEKVNIPVVHSALIWYLASKRQGTHAAKTKGEVSGGGIKPWRQKGTGRARVGSIRSPLWRHGGVIFPPKLRDYSYSLPKKIRKLAIKIALSDKAASDNIKVLSDLKVEAPKTREMVKILDNLKVENKALIVVPKVEEDLAKASRNIDGIKLVTVNDLNIHDLLNYELLLLTKGAAQKLEEVLK